MVTCRRTLTCPAGDVRGGKFALTHMNNWTHASMYPAFILSGEPLGLVVLGLGFGPNPAALSIHECTLALSASQGRAWLQLVLLQKPEGLGILFEYGCSGSNTLPL